MNGMIAAFVLSVCATAAPPNQSWWSGDYGQALAQTRASGRPLIVVLEDPARPQVRVEQASLGSYLLDWDLLARYVLCRVDVTTEYGQRVADVFQASKFPHTAIIDRTGRQIVFRKTGVFEPDQWRSTLAAYQHGEIAAPPRSSYEYSRGAACFT